MIRPATHDDVARMVEMGLRFIGETSYRDKLAGDPVRIAVSIAKLVRDGGVFVSEAADGRLVGMLGGFVYLHPFSGECQACEAFWWVEPEHRGGMRAIRLLHAFAQWGRLQGATRVLMIAPSAAVEDVYQRLGFDRVEVTYQRAL